MRADGEHVEAPRGLVGLGLVLTERDVHVERAEAPRARRRDDRHGRERGGKRRAARLHPRLVGRLVEAVRLQFVEVAPAEPTRGTATEPAAPLGPVLGEHVAEDALGLGELGVIERIASDRRGS